MAIPPNIAEIRQAIADLKAVLPEGTILAVSNSPDPDSGEPPWIVFDQALPIGDPTFPMAKQIIRVQVTTLVATLIKIGEWLDHPDIPNDFEIGIEAGDAWVSFQGGAPMSFERLRESMGSEVIAWLQQLLGAIKFRQDNPEGEG